MTTSRGMTSSIATIRTTTEHEQRPRLGWGERRRICPSRDEGPWRSPPAGARFFATRAVGRRTGNHGGHRRYGMRRFLNDRPSRRLRGIWALVGSGSVISAASVVPFRATAPVDFLCGGGEIAADGLDVVSGAWHEHPPAWRSVYPGMSRWYGRMTPPRTGDPPCRSR